MIELNKEQELVKNSIMSKLQQIVEVNGWHGFPKTLITVVGYAGTGKTVLLSMLRKELDKIFPGLRAAMITFTGKASTVLETKLRQNNAIYYGDFVGTIHSLMYKPQTIYDPNLKRKVIVGWSKRRTEEILVDVILIDEASMVSNNIMADLSSYKLPIIAFGDNGQLPPINERTNLLDNPDYKLKEIHRQALESPIIKLAHFVRRGGKIPVNAMYSKDVFKLSWKDPNCQKMLDKIKIDDDCIFLCGFNSTRVKLNDIIRKKLGFKHPEPYPTERIICLKNNYNSKLMNGQISTVLWYMPEMKNGWRLTILPDDFDEPFETLANTICFGKEQYPLYDFLRTKKSADFEREVFKRGFASYDFFDYGYACSVHKSQGSEWDRVILFEQRTHRWDDSYYAKWLYTAVTRAKKKLFIINDFY
jgi:exodeoxyribonuclease-5